jgi:hypothetical protein
MKTNEKLFYLIVSLGNKINHFFLLIGKIDDSEIHKLDRILLGNNVLLLISVDDNNKDWGFFWNEQKEDDKINTFHFYNRFGVNYKDDIGILNRLLNLPAEILEILDLQHGMLLKDITNINSILEKINTHQIIWRNNNSLENEPNKADGDWSLFKSNFLNKLFYSKICRFCYLVLNERQKEDEYYILNQSFRSEQKLLLIEREDQEESRIERFRIKILSQKQKHSYYFFNENQIEVINDFYIYIFDKYTNYEREYDELFMINKHDKLTIEKTINSLDDKFCYKWIDEKIFVEFNKENKFQEVKNSLWKEKELFGLIIREHEFSRRHSDFGSDNSHIVVFGNSKYPSLRNILPVDVWWTPRGVENSMDNKTFDDYYHMNKNIYEHFYQSRKYLLINFDEIPYIERVNRYYQGYIVDDIKKLAMLKTIRLPTFLLEDSFILTTDIFV